MSRTRRRAERGTLLLVSLLLAPAWSYSQAHDAGIDSLVARALAANPRLRAAEAEAAAARARISPAGAWPDPMLMAGVENLPLSRAPRARPGPMAGPDPMTMQMVGVSQRVPYPGKPSLQSAVAQSRAEAAEARLAAFRLTIRRDLLDAYYDLATARTVLALIARQQDVAANVIPAAEARYVSGTVAQSDIIRARTEAARLVEERNAAEQQERTALARLNAILDQAFGTSVPVEPLTELDVRWMPSLDSLYQWAMRGNPVLRERRASIQARAAEVELARREHLPDVEVSLRYGRRDGLPDVVTAAVGVPLPIQRGRKQNADVRAARLEVAAAEADLRAEENALRAAITRTHAAIARQRANAELLARAILPQARATFASTSGAYQSGRSELLTVLDAMRGLFATETMYVRTIADLARAIAELQMLVGLEVAP